MKSDGFAIPIVVVAAFTLAIIILSIPMQYTQEEEYNTLFSDQARITATTALILTAASSGCDWGLAGTTLTTCIDSNATALLSQLQPTTPLLSCTVSPSTKQVQPDGNWLVKVPFACQAQITNNKTNIQLAYTKQLLIKKSSK